jgi:heat shock protein HtpX
VGESNLFEQQRRNRRRSAILVTVFVLFFAWIGFGGDLGLYLSTVGTTDPSPYRHSIPWFGIVTTALGIGMVFFAWRRGPRQVLWATGAWELVAPSNPEEQQLVNVVEEMAIASGLPKPRIWIVPEKDPNAFATGIDEAHAHIAVTEGLLTVLNRDQLQGVVAHEMAHVQNHDVKLMTLLAALVGTIAIVSDGMGRIMRFGGTGRSRGGGGKKGGNPLAIIVLVLWIVSIILAPIVSRLLALAVSRKREFLADATAAQFTRNPEALASALRAIEDHHAPTTAIKQGAAHLCIADPLGRRLTTKQGFLADLLATHPPMGMRVSRLNAMAYKFKKTGELSTEV